MAPVAGCGDRLGTAPLLRDHLMQIRRLESADVPAWRALRLRALREQPEAFTSSYEEDAAQPLAAAQDRIASASFAAWGAFEQAELCGIVGLQREGRAKNL